MTLRYFVRFNYGSYTEYLADPAQAAALSSVTGKKTINASDRESLSALTGCTWELVQDPRATPPTVR